MLLTIPLTRTTIQCIQTNVRDKIYDFWSQRKCDLLNPLAKRVSKLHHSSGLSLSESKPEWL